MLQTFVVSRIARPMALAVELKAERFQEVVSQFKVLGCRKSCDMTNPWRDEVRPADACDYW